MNKNSHICQFVYENQDEWQKKMEDMGIRVKFDENLAIFNYDMLRCDFSDPVVQEARGIIIDMNDLEVVCWPFRKFGNYSEPYADIIDWSTARVQDKIDGSIVKLWYYGGRWNWSTNGMIYAEKAPAEQGGNYLALIAGAVNFHDIPYDQLDRNCTYIFELATPEGHVVHYPVSRLYHLGTRNRITGQESDSDIGIIKPEEFPIHSIGECIDAAGKLNCDSDRVEKEGFVVLDRNWNRIKVKSPIYLTGHYLKSSDNIKASDIIHLIMSDSSDLTKICKGNEFLTLQVKYYDYRIAEIVYHSGQTALYAKALYEEFSHSRKAVAEVLKKQPYAAVGFWAIDHPNEPVMNYWYHEGTVITDVVTGKEYASEKTALAALKNVYHINNPTEHDFTGRFAIKNKVRDNISPIIENYKACN